MHETLNPVFSPESVAVIGASTQPGSIGWYVVHNIVTGDFNGKLFPVNPKADVVRSVKAYPSIVDVPDRVDLAFIVVPSRFVPGVARQCVEKGVRGLVVISAGFSETGDTGGELEAQLLQIVRTAGMRLVGPNCMGLVDAVTRHVFSFVTPALWEEGLVAGNVSLIALRAGVVITASPIQLVVRTTIR